MKLTCIKLISISILLIWGSLTEAQTPTSGLVGWWSFTGNAADSSSFGNDGTVNGASLTADRFGNSNSAYSFDGDQDYIDLGNDASLMSSSHSLVFWFKYSDKSANMMLLNNAKSASGEWGVTSMFTTTKGLVYNCTAGSNNHASYAQSDSFLNDNQWHCYAGTYDKYNNVMSLYLDGVLVTNQNNSGSQGALTSSDSVRFYANEHWMVGAASTYFSSGNKGNPMYFKGDLDDIRIYNRALTATEILSLFKDGTSSAHTLFTVARIFPNPTQNKINIETGDYLNWSGNKISIYSVTGKKLIEQTISSNQTTIDMSAIGTKGIYTLHISDPYGTVLTVKKIMLH
ncbi:MAG: T9SS type A sorting domain-containing protein [Flavobacteriales bacterium]|nr:T9SS type A sorting domain-containing protein [Flavobacteriales bacterium]